MELESLFYLPKLTDYFIATYFQKIREEQYYPKL